MKHFNVGRLLVLAPFLPVLISRAHKGFEQRMRLQRLRLELRMELASDEVRVVGQFDRDQDGLLPLDGRRIAVVFE